MDIRWKVTDPLGNEVYLTEDSFQTHVINDRQNADAVVRMSLEENVKYSLQNPRFIVKAEIVEGRRVYLDLADVIRDDMIHVRPLFIVTEADGKVVTWFAKRSVNIKVFTEGGILYDRRISHV